MSTSIIPKHILSKSTYMYGCQCQKRLWLYKHQPDLRDEMDESQAAIFQRGTDVGLLAQGLFPGGVNASPPTFFEYQLSVADTARSITEGHTIIYEAAFQFEGVLCAVDILVKRNGKWYAYEVKSSTRVKDPFVQDAALQYYVITNLGMELADIFIVHLNNEYVRTGELDIHSLFAAMSVKTGVQALQPLVAQKIIELKSVVASKQVPVMTIGDHCYKPYGCDFHGHCHQDEVADPPEAEYINRDAINDFIAQLRYPLYYLDFETWMTAVPECDGHWPYRQVPFQFSLHIQGHEKAELQHHQYLAEHPHSALEDFIEALVSKMGTRGSVVVYNKTFENQVLEKLANDFPKRRNAITAIQKRMVDLMSPFRKNYRLPAMEWSYSIKYVLPALVPELSYDNLVIGNGSDASAAFYHLQHEKDELKIQETRNALLEYCGLDTLAMVRILERLYEINS